MQRPDWAYGTILGLPRGSKGRLMFVRWAPERDREIPISGNWFIGMGLADSAFQAAGEIAFYTTKQARPEGENDG